jgi:hypothetical protein
MILDHDVALVEGTRVLREWFKWNPEGRECLAEHRVSVGCSDHVWASFVDSRVQYVGSAIYRVLAEYYIASVIHEDEIRDGGVAEREAKRVDPEQVRELRVSDRDVAGDALAEPKAAKDTQSAGQLLLAS